VNGWKPRPWASPSVVFFRMVAIAMATAGCSTLAAADTGAQLDFARREQLPQVGDIDPKPLRIAVAAAMSPEDTAESYVELAAYLEDKLGGPAGVVQRRTYAEIESGR